MKYSLTFMIFLFWEFGSARAKSYTHSEEGSCNSVDPVTAGSVYANRLITSVFDTLYEYKYLQRPFTLKPNLAKELPHISKDGLTYLIPLKRGVFFADDPAFAKGKGRELTATDVVYSIKRHFDPKNRSRGKWVWSDLLVGLDEWSKTADYSKDVEGLKAIDRYTVQLKLSHPRPHIVYTFAHGFSAVVPKEAIDKYGKEFGLHPVGSGPWQLKELNKYQAKLKKNPNYRKEIFDIYEHGFQESEHGFTGIKSLHGKQIPLLDEVIVNFADQKSSNWMSFAKGSEVQYTVLPPQQSAEVITSKEPLAFHKQYTSKYHIVPIKELAFTYFAFNMANPTFGNIPGDLAASKRNKALRCAIRKSFNWKQFIGRNFHGIGEPFPGIVPEILDDFDPSLSKESITLDPVGAKKILSQHGWTQEKLPTLDYNSYAAPNTRYQYEMFRSWLKKISWPESKIKLKLHKSFADYLQEMRQGNLASYATLSWNLDFPDAENAMQLFYGAYADGGANLSNYSNPEFDKLLDEAVKIGPSNRRKSLFRKMNELLIEDCVVISGYSRTFILLWHKNVILYPAPHVIGNIFKFVDIKK
ncbi:MAG: ABC transporter substrate-binding protein [Oligoflexales bacterium]